MLVLRRISTPFHPCRSRQRSARCAPLAVAMPTRDCLLAVLASFAPLVAATTGVDVSQPVSASAASCMHANGRDFAIVRAWKSYGAFDDAAPGSVAAFWAGGFKDVDVYAFPCAGRPALPQMSALNASLAHHGVRFGMVVRLRVGGTCADGTQHSCSLPLLPVSGWTLRATRRRAAGGPLTSRLTARIMAPSSPLLAHRGGTSAHTRASTSGARSWARGARRVRPHLFGIPTTSRRHNPIIMTFPHSADGRCLRSSNTQTGLPSAALALTYRGIPEKNV